MKIKSVYFLTTGLVLWLLTFNCFASSGTIKSEEGRISSTLYTTIDNYLTSEGSVHLDLFVMSHCPFGVEAEKVIVPLVKESNGKVILNLFFLAQETAEGKFVSMHGDAEVEEDIRQMVISKLYPDKLSDYLILMAQDDQQPDWVKTATYLGMNVNRLRAEISKPETKEAFKNNIQKGINAGISSSPSLFINNQPYEGSIFDFEGGGGGCANVNNDETVISLPEPSPVAVGDSAQCGTQMYSKKNQDCITCGGVKTVVAKGTDCCTGVLYDHACFRCENGQVVGKCPPGHICCDGNCSINNTQTCITCNGKKVFVNPGQKCCENGQIYNSNDSDCIKCGSTYSVVPKGQQCCAGLLYDTKTKDCITCNGNQIIVPKGNQCCQNGQIYNPNDSDCIKCGNTYSVVPKGQQCCAGLPYDTKTMDCIACNENQIIVPKGDVCCQNGQVYNPNDSDCIKCGNTYSVVPKGQTTCCNGLPFNSKTQDCITCNGNQIVVPKGDVCCQNGQVYNPKDSSCIQCGSVYKIVAKGQDCCAGMLYDHTCERCKDGRVESKCPPGHFCCDGNCSINNTQDCLTCNGKKILVNKGQKCCPNGQIYNSSSQDCIQCGSGFVVVTKGNLCCGNATYDPICFKCVNLQVVDKCPAGQQCCRGNCTVITYTCKKITTVVDCKGSNTTTTPFTCTNTYTPPPCQTTGKLIYSQGVCVGGSVVTDCYSGPVPNNCLH